MPQTTKLTERALPERLPPYGVLMLESHHAPNFTMEWRTHAFLKVIYILSGEGACLIEEARYPFVARDAIVVPPGQRNRIVDAPSAAASLYVFCLDTKLLAFDPSILSGLEAGRLRRSAPFAARLERVLRRLLFEQSHQSVTTPLALVAEALQLVQMVLLQPIDSDAVPPPASDPRREMAGYVRYLDHHFYEATSIDQAAAMVGIPRRSFTALFRELTGTTWLQYVQRLRLRHAIELLQSTDLPIAAIAFECGFDDLSTFYRRFRDEYAVPPGRYRAGSDPSEGASG